MKRTFYIAFGTICFVLGVIGVFLPVLPTTPFLLLTAWAYAKSSDKLYTRLMNNRFFGKYIRIFREERAIPLHGKIIAIISMWSVILYTVIVVLSDKWYLQLLLIIIALSVTIHILSFKTKKIGNGRREK